MELIHLIDWMYANPEDKFIGLKINLYMITHHGGLIVGMVMMPLERIL